jgi:leucine-rich repeat protein SHOC2
MEEAELEQIIEKARIDRRSRLRLNMDGIKVLPDSIGNLDNLTYLNLRDNQLTSLPETIGNLSKLTDLDLLGNQLTSLPESIGNLTRLTSLCLSCDRLNTLPKSIGNLSSLSKLILDSSELSILPDNLNKIANLEELFIESNYFTDLSILATFSKLELVWFLDVYLPPRYWTQMSEWKAAWLLDEDNIEISRTLIEQVGYEKICQELGSVNIDTWREYTLLSIDGIPEYEDDGTLTGEPMVLLKMTCPSTGHIHILRVPPEMTSAEAAITWVNHGIHPDEFAVQT